MLIGGFEKLLLCYFQCRILNVCCCRLKGLCLFYYSILFLLSKLSTMGSFLTKIKGEEAETPGKESVVKRIEDPRSPTDDISRTPIEVADKVPKECIRQLAFANALKEQNKTVYESSPIYSRPEKYDNIKPKYLSSKTLDSIPILQADESSSLFNISAIEKENTN